MAEISIGFETEYGVLIINDRVIKMEDLDKVRECRNILNEVLEDNTDEILESRDSVIESKNEKIQELQELRDELEDLANSE